MTEGRKLSRPVYIGHEQFPAGTVLTDEQAEKITNPKAFQREETFTDKVKAAAAAKAARDAEQDDDTAADPAAVKDDRAENGAALARAAKAAAAAKAATPKA